MLIWPLILYCLNGANGFGDGDTRMKPKFNGDSYGTYFQQKNGEINDAKIGWRGRICIMYRDF